METVVCALCQKESLKSDIQVLGAKGIATLNSLLGENLEIGQYIHLSCRRKVVSQIDDTNDEKEECSTSSRRKGLRSFSYCYEKECLFCGNGGKYQRKKTVHTLSSVSFPKFENSLKEAIKKRDPEGDWTESVEERYDYVLLYHENLIEAKAVYHSQCWVNFANPEQHVPKIFQSVQTGIKKGRYVNSTQNEAFQQVCMYLENEKEKALTITDLSIRMKEILHGADESAYSNRWIKSKLVEHYGDKVMLTESSGKSTIVTLRENITDILSQLRSSMNVSDDSELNSNTIIEAAARIIKADVMKVKQANQYFPSCDDMREENALNFVPASLNLLLKNVFAGEYNVKKAFIGQAIMQACRPRTLTCPLLLGLGIQLHNQFQSRLLVDEIHKAGFSQSYHLVEKFERAAAVTNGLSLPDMDENANIQYVGDNVDVNLCTIDGKGTFHAMGMIATVTPRVSVSTKVLRRNVTNDEIRQVGHISISHLLDDEVGINPAIILRPLKPATPLSEFSTDIDLLWKISLSFDSIRPGWFGTMQMIEKGNHPGKSSIVYLPIIDMDPGNLSCIHSTLTYIQNHARKYNCTPIVTFDQPLYWKALAVLEKGDVGKMFIRLGGFHTLMNFLGSIGDLMENTGIENVLQLIYAQNTVPHIMDGKAVSRALRANLLLFSVLYSLVVAEMYSDQGSEDEDVFICGELEKMKTIFDHQMSDPGFYLQITRI